MINLEIWEKEYYEWKTICAQKQFQEIENLEIKNKSGNYLQQNKKMSDFELIRKSEDEVTLVNKMWNFMRKIVSVNVSVLTT